MPVGSPHCPTDEFVSYCLVLRFQLLSTSPHDDAVTFSYRFLASPDEDFHLAVRIPSRAHRHTPSGVRILYLHLPTVTLSSLRSQAHSGLHSETLFESFLFPKDFFQLNSLTLKMFQVPLIQNSRSLVARYGYVVKWRTRGDCAFLTMKTIER